MPSPINLQNGGEYVYVHLGPIPGLPDWHEQSSPSYYAFPTVEAARRFAAGAADRHPDRQIRVG